MSAFLALMIIGLLGMVLMAIPGLSHHGHGGLMTHGHAGHNIGNSAHTVHSGPAITRGGPSPHVSGGTPAAPGAASNGSSFQLSRLIPTPRVIFSMLAAYGAFGYALVGAAKLSQSLTAWLAIVPALLLQRFALEPLWQAMLQFQGTPCAPLTEMVMSEAVAVTPFRNGKGIVQVVRDGREVQFSARLQKQQAAMPVKVGDLLVVDDVDEAKERVVVSMR